MDKFANDLPHDTYIPCVGWEVGFEDDFVPRPALGLHERALVPQSFQVECHGLKIAYNLPDSVMQMHGLSGDERDQNTTSGLTGDPVPPSTGSGAKVIMNS
jgi:hypothetical protein